MRKRTCPAPRNSEAFNAATDTREHAMVIGRVAAASFLGLVCFAIFTFGSQVDKQPRSGPAKEILQPAPEGGAVPDVVKSRLVRPRIAREALEESKLTYGGTVVKCSLGATGDELNIQAQVATKLSQLDFVPEARIKHFQWMGNYPVKIVKWKGQIQSCGLTPNGFLARVLVQPVAVPTTGKYVVHRDYFLEDYLLGKDGGLEFVGFQDPGPRPGFFPVR